MKKLLSLLALVLCLGLLGGCTASQEGETTQPTVTETPSSEASTEASTEVSTQTPTEPSAMPSTEGTTEPSTEPATEPATEAATEPPADSSVVRYADTKAIWLSQFDLTGIYLDGGTQREEADFTARMAQVLDNVKAQGFNTVFLQVRPYADSMYPSAYYPMSAYVVGTLGAQARYDPVERIVELAHERDLSIHAWINPMRGMGEAEILQVGQEYTLRRWYDNPDLRGRYLVLVNGRWYLNPAYGEVADLIVAGAEELLTLYDFDGLHMDDYFYPTTDTSFDALAYDAFGGSKSLAEFRRGNLNLLVRRLCELTHSSRDGRVFGISPAGNVDTVYNTQYADIYRWCSAEGYIDYICPQVYFGLEHGSYDFQKVCQTYQDMIQVDSVELIIGMTFGKALTGEDKWAGTGKDEWKDNKDVLARCLQTTLDLPKCRGVAVFCYQYLFDPLTGQPVPETAQEQESFFPVLKAITWSGS